MIYDSCRFVALMGVKGIIFIKGILYKPAFLALYVFFSVIAFLFSRNCLSHHAYKKEKKNIVNASEHQ